MSIHTHTHTHIDILSDSFENVRFSTEGQSNIPNIHPYNHKSFTNQPRDFRSYSDICYSEIWLEYFAKKKNLVVKPQNHKNWKSGLKLSNFGFWAFAWILIGLSLIEELYLKINWKLSFVGERLLHLKLIHNAINPLNLSEGRTDRNTWFHSRQSMYSPIDWSSTNFHFSLSRNERNLRQSVSLDEVSLDKR